MTETWQIVRFVDAVYGPDMAEAVGYLLSAEDCSFKEHVRASLLRDMSHRLKHPQTLP